MTDQPTTTPLVGLEAALNGGFGDSLKARATHEATRTHKFTLLDAYEGQELKVEFVVHTKADLSEIETDVESEADTLVAVTSEVILTKNGVTVGGLSWLDVRTLQGLPEALTAGETVMSLIGGNQTVVTGLLLQIMEWLEKGRVSAQGPLGLIGGLASAMAEATSVS